MRPETRVGKGEGNDLVLDDPTVSTAHALIRAEAGAFTVTDLGSRNGTYVNGERVTDPRPLADGDLIKLGRSTLKFQLEHQRETTILSPASPAEPPTLETPPPLTELSLARAVIDAGLAERSEVERLRAAEAGGRRLYRALVDEGLVSEEQLRDLMSATFHLPVVNLRGVELQESLLASWPAPLLRQHSLLPLSAEAGALTVALADPTDAEALAALKREGRKTLDLRLATSGEIQALLAAQFGSKLIGVLPSGEKFEFLINRPEVEIGKAPHNHLVLAEPTVSQTHAVLIAQGGGYSIVDLGSRNGTFVNGERLGDAPCTLRHGDKVRLGQALLTFRNPAETAESRTAQLPAGTLEEVRRRVAGGEFAEAPAVTPPAPSLPEPGNVTPAEIERPAPEVAPKASKAEAEKDDADRDGAGKGEKKKKKKKKKDKQDERVKAALISSLGRILAAVLSVILTVLVTIYLMRSGSGTGPGAVDISKKGHLKPKLNKVSAGVPFRGGMFEASGVVSVAGTDGVLFVDDNRPSEVLWMRLDQSGNQVGEIQPVPLGVAVEDPEGITYGGSYFYVISSQSRPKAGARNALVRFAFDAANRRLPGPAEVIEDLRGFLLANVPELKAAGEQEESGLNIEGLAWDPIHERLLLGLRAPLADGQALIIPLKLQNPLGPFSAANLQLAEPRAIRLPLDGQGIRDLQYDSRLKSFLIISGAPEHHEKTEFKLWDWGGNTEESNADSAPHEQTTLDRKLKPEGITHMTINGRDFIFIVGDASGYLKLDYPDSQ